jgi:predicted amidophosphoribosyltransferase
MKKHQRGERISKGSPYGICYRCGGKYLLGYNKAVCPDCVMKSERHFPSLGRETLCKHFDQDIGERLRRMKYGHFGDDHGLELCDDEESYQ